MGKRVSQKSKRQFAAALKAWRKRNDLSQAKAAALLGISLDTLQNWEIARSLPQGFGYASIMAILQARP